MWRLDTQEIEGVNSVLKYCTQLSSNLGWKLMSARTVLKKRLLMCADSDARKELVESFVAFFDDARDVAADAPIRFRKVSLDEFPLAGIPRDWGVHEPTIHDGCAARFIIALKHVFKNAGIAWD
eukprot:4111496-Pyramimonas_sp.AAC.1